MTLLALLMPVFAEERESDKESPEIEVKEKDWTPGEVYVLYPENKLCKKNVYFAPDELIYHGVSFIERSIPNNDPKLWKAVKGAVKWPQNLENDQKLWKGNHYNLIDFEYSHEKTLPRYEMPEGLTCCMGRLFLFDKKNLEDVTSTIEIDAASIHMPPGKSVEVQLCSLFANEGKIAVLYQKRSPDVLPDEEYLGLVNLKDGKLEEICLNPLNCSSSGWCTVLGWCDNKIVLYSLDKYRTGAAVIDVKKKKAVMLKRYTTQGEEYDPNGGEQGCLHPISVYNGKVYGFHQDESGKEKRIILYPDKASNK